MPINKRQYYPIHAVGFASGGTPHNETGYWAAKGVQSVGYNTNFNLEQVFQLGQLEIYENIENIPDVEITIEKVVDGWPLLSHLATPLATSNTLGGRYNDNQCMCGLAYYNINSDYAAGYPSILSMVTFSGAYLSALNWTIPVEGNITESITLVANDKTWYTTSGDWSTLQPWTTATQFDGNEGPSGDGGGVQRRENVVMETGSVGGTTTGSLFPTDIPGIHVSGWNVTGDNGEFGAHIQNINISTSLGRTDLFELGRKGPYFRYAEFPTEVTCSIETTASELGDGINADSEADNVTDQEIMIILDQGIIIDLGTRNKLASVAVAGGDTGGGNVTVTYNYSNFNSLTITNRTDQDPAGQTL